MSASDEPALPREHERVDGYKSRWQQITELAMGSIVTETDEPDDPEFAGARLELYVKEKPRGKNYVADFVYSDRKLPITACGVLLQTPSGLAIGELEIFRVQWGYFDDYGDYVGPDGEWRGKEDEYWDVSALPDSSIQGPPFQGITGALLRAIPVGRILAWAHDAMANNEWREKGLPTLSQAGVRLVPPTELAPDTRAALERSAAASTRKKGRPPLSDELLEDVALAYLEEAKRGRGLTARLAARFDRPNETIRDWIHACRKRGYLSQGTIGRRGAQPGERLLMAISPDEDRGIETDTSED
ncbi:hypothetical protein [Micromonospora sp. NPDC048898]|uniref:hypothetical protein n=1 Tax=Micromonospora sp. NPDC048898 TaxID=3364260 RepID=UPI003712B163